MGVVREEGKVKREGRREKDRKRHYQDRTEDTAGRQHL